MNHANSSTTILLISLLSVVAACANSDSAEDGLYREWSDRTSQAKSQVALDTADLVGAWRLYEDIALVHEKSLPYEGSELFIEASAERKPVAESAAVVMIFANSNMAKIHVPLTCSNAQREPLTSIPLLGPLLGPVELTFKLAELLDVLDGEEDLPTYSFTGTDRSIRFDTNPFRSDLTPPKVQVITITDGQLDLAISPGQLYSADTVIKRYERITEDGLRELVRTPLELDCD